MARKALLTMRGGDRQWRVSPQGRRAPRPAACSAGRAAATSSCRVTWGSTCRTPTAVAASPAGWRRRRPAGRRRRRRLRRQPAGRRAASTSRAATSPSPRRRAAAPITPTAPPSDDRRPTDTAPADGGTAGPGGGRGGGDRDRGAATDRGDGQGDRGDERHGIPPAPPEPPPIREPRRHPDRREPRPDDRGLRPGAARRPELRHRPVHDPAVPAADLPGLRDRVRDSVAGARLDQPDRDRLRHQPQRLDRRRPGLDAVHPLDLGDVRGRRERGRAQGSLQPGRRDLRRGALPGGRRRAGGPAHRDLRLQPRRLVRRRGPAVRQPVRQAPRDPGQLAHRADRGRALPRRRRRPLRRRHLRAPGARALEARQAPRRRQRRRGDLELPDPARGQHLLQPGRSGRRGQRRRDHRDRQVEAARPLHRPARRLRQPLHLRRARRGRQGLPGAEAA